MCEVYNLILQFMNAVWAAEENLSYVVQFVFNE